MDRNSVFQDFCSLAPFAVLTQVVLRSCICDTFAPAFERARGRQYEDKLTFEDLAIAVADVALGVCENVNQAYRKHKKQLGVARGRFYDKINNTSTNLSEELVSSTASRIAEMQDAIGFVQWAGIPGYRMLSVDGNHLEKTDKRLGNLQGSNVAPLPGTAVGRLDLDRQVFDRVYLLEDAHQQEATKCHDIAEDLVENDVLVADRHYCVVEFMNSIDAKGCHFIIRHHARLPGVLIGSRKKLGRIDTGMVYEQTMQLTKKEGSLVVRRITIELDEPTQDGDTVIHILTNLPSSVCGKLVAEQYHRRWDAETGFYYLRMCFNGELPTIGHPRAALFLFSMAILAFNVLQVILAAFWATHSEDDVKTLSNLYISQNISQNTSGMLIALNDESWDAIIPNTPKRVAQLLKRIAKATPIAEYRKSERTPKPKVPGRKKKRKKKSNKAHVHLSTAKAIGLVTP